MGLEYLVVLSLTVEMSLNKCQIASICISVVLLVTAAVLLIGNYHMKLLDQEISSQLAISIDSPQYDQWVDPPPPIYMEYWMFNLTNPVEFLKGEKANLSQIGPFAYQLHQPRYDVEFYSNDTVAYRYNHTYVYNAAMSVKHPSEVSITTVNIPLLLVIDLLESLGYGEGWIKTLIKFITKESPIITHTAEEILFGYNDTIFKYAHKISPSLPDKFGLFYGTNNTDDGVYLVDTGKKHIRNVNSIQKWNYNKSLDYWSTRYGNMINGTDGVFFHPKMSTDETIYTYSTDICRSLPLGFEEQSKIKGLRAYKYHTTEMAFANTTVNPDNAAFCVPAGNCMGTGVLNISVCKQGAPIVISSPHFYLADDKYVNGVIGMHPSKEEHETYIAVEPSTGVVLNAQKRIQLNAQVKPTNLHASLQGFTETTLPLLWLNESALIDDGSAKHLKQVEILEGLVYSLPFVLIGICVILVVYIVVSVVVSRKKHKLLVNADSDPDSEPDE